MESGFNVLENILGNLNTWLIVLETGLIMWMIRQVMPDSIENSKIWKIFLRLIPMAIGIILSIIPGLRPFPDNVAQSCGIGFIGGSLSQSVYDFFKSLLSDRMRKIISSKGNRNIVKNDELQYYDRI
jgi:hypothetical protein